MTLGPPPSYDASALSSHNQHGINDDLPRYDHTSSLDIKEKEKGDDNAKENGLGRIRSALSMNDRTGSSFGSGSGSIPSSKGWLARKKEERDQRKAKKIEEDRAEGEAMIARINVSRSGHLQFEQVWSSRGLSLLPSNGDQTSFDCYREPKACIPCLERSLFS